MKHYPHHIGDFDRATRHLTRIERSVYRDLIDLYYDTEEPLTLDLQALCRRIIARSNEESTAVEQVLNEFFTETPTGWFHARCDDEILAYQANTSQKAQAGKASAAAKALRKQQAMNGNLTPVERPLNSVATADNGASTNHQPSTINHQPKNTPPVGVAPIPKKAKPKTTGLPEDFGISDGVREWAASNRFGRLDEHLEAFRRKATAKAYTYASWDDAFMEAIREDWAKLRTVSRVGYSASDPTATVPSRQGVDPALAKAIKDSLSGAKPSAEIRQRMAELTGARA